MQKNSLKIFIGIFLIFALNTNVKADHIFSDSEKEKIYASSATAISKVAKDLALSETVLKYINKYVVGDLVMHVLSYMDEAAVNRFLKYSSGTFATKFANVLVAYKKNNTVEFIRKYKSGADFLKENKLDIFFVVSDILMEFVKIEIYKNNEAKNVLIDLLYSDAKSYIKYASGDPLGGTIDWGIANAEALYKSTTGIYKLVQENRDLIKNIHMNKARRESYTLDLKYSKLVGRTNDIQKKKARLNSFMTECRTNIVINYYLDDKVIEDFCSNIKSQIIVFDSNKLNYLLQRMTAQSGLYSKEDFKEYLNNFFPEEDKVKYRLAYDSINDNLAGINPKSVSYTYLKKSIRYGFRLSDFIPNGENIYNPTANVSRYDFIRVFLTGKYILNQDWTRENDIVSEQLYKIVGTNNTYRNTFLTRQQSAEYILRLFDLESKLTENQKLKLKLKAHILESNTETQWTYEALILQKLKIVSYNKNFRGTDNINTYEMLVMLLHTLDYMRCGHANCSYLEFIYGESK